MRLAVAALALLLAGCETAHDPASPTASPSSQAHAYLHVADQTRLAGDDATAVGLYQKVLALDPDNADAEDGLGASAMALGQPAQAATAFTAAIRARPDRAEGYEGLSRALLGKGDRDGAIATVDQARARGIASSILANTKGVALDLGGRHEDARAVYRAALVADPGDRRTENNLALSLAATHDYQAALAILRRLGADPASGPRVRRNFALVLALSGAPQEAQTLAGGDLPADLVLQDVRFAAVVRGPTRPSGDL